MKFRLREARLIISHKTVVYRISQLFIHLNRYTTKTLKYSLTQTNLAKMELLLLVIMYSHLTINGVLMALKKAVEIGLK
jgi:hypothetical protein